MASKKRRSYRAYAPGSVQKKVTSELRHAVSELRHGKTGCKFALENLKRAMNEVDAASQVRSSGGGYKYPAMALVKQENRIQRVARIYRAKCGPAKL